MDVDPPLLLLTGFEPFGKHSRNPSFEAIEAFASQSPVKGLCIETLCLPVVFGDAEARLFEAMDRLQPNAILSFGIHGGADSPDRLPDGFYIEEFAHNMDSARIADNSGVQPLDQPIDLDAPLDSPLGSTLPMKAMEQAMGAAGARVELSGDAGRYLCNHIFYCALMRARTYKQPPGVGFIHIPPYSSDVEDELRDTDSEEQTDTSQSDARPFSTPQDYFPVIEAAIRAIRDHLRADAAG